MKICWDNLDKIRFCPDSKRFIKGTNELIIKICEECGDEFLSYKNNIGRFCSLSCRSIFCNKNKIVSEDTKNKISKNLKEKYKIKENHPMYGKNHTEKSKRKMSKSSSGDKSGNWKGGITSKNITWFDTYSHKISYVETIRNNKGILEAKCVYCGKWFIPTMSSIRSRIKSLEGMLSGENRLYCSNECKKECPTYRQHLLPKGFKPATSREVQPELRQMVFERDNYTCVKCGVQKLLHCHHIEGIRWEPLESADIDKCITLCKTCHKQVHKTEGCSYYDLKCK